MREPARALDEVSDHLGEVLRRADELLVEWSRFGGQVRAQVEREATAIGQVVDGAVERAAGAGIDRAIGDRLRALTAELERLEQRARTASRAVVDQRAADRRVLWVVVAGVVLANALLVALLLRRPVAEPVAEPVRIEATTAPQAPVDPPQAAAAAGSAEPAASGVPSTGSAGSAAPLDPRSPSQVGAANGPGAGGASGATAGSGAGDARTGATAGSATGKATPAAGGKPAGETAGPSRTMASPIALPPHAGSARPHKKLP